MHETNGYVYFGSMNVMIGPTIAHWRSMSCAAEDKEKEDEVTVVVKGFFGTERVVVALTGTEIVSVDGMGNHC